MARVVDRINNANKELKSSNKYKALEAFFDRHKLHSSNMLLPPKLWAQILCEAIINLKEIYECFDNSTHFRNTTRTDWVSLWYFIELEDDDAKSIIESIVKKINEHSYEDPGVVLHIYGSLLRRNEEGFELTGEIGNTPEKIEEHAKKYIDHLYETDRLPSREDIAKMYLDTAYRGLGYTSLDSKHFKNIRTYFFEKCREKLCKVSQEKINELLDYMVTNPSEFYGLIASSIHNSNNDRPNYWNVPIFQNINPEQFFTIYKKIPNVNKRWINDAFKERYKLINQHHPHLKVDYAFSDELDFMKEFLKLVEDTTNKASSFTPSIWHLNYFKEHGLKFAIEELKNFTKTQELASDSEM